jgi:hypothetical protein
LYPLGLAFSERRVGEQCRCNWLQSQAYPELLHHVGFRTVVKINLNGTGPKHHVESETANPGHMPKHDPVAALGHDWQVGSRLVGPHAEAEEAEPKPVADGLHLLKVTAAFGATSWRSRSGAPDSSSCPAGSQADGPVDAGERG